MANTKFKESLLIIPVLFLGLMLRLISLGQSLWLDEAIGAIAVKSYSYWGIVNIFMKADNHPPLYYLILKFWTNIFGYSEISIRFPSIVFGIGTIYLLYLIAKEIFSSKNLAGFYYFPILSALFLATSQFHIYYSQEARMYSLAAFFVSLAFFAYFKLLDSVKGTFFYWCLFSVSILGLVFSDYVTLFILPVFWIFNFIKRKDLHWWKFFLISQIPLAFLGFLWLPNFLLQVESGRWLLNTWPAWKTVAGGATIKQILLVFIKFSFGRISISNKVFYYFLIVLVSIPLLISLLNSFKKYKEQLLLWSWFFIPLTLSFFVSFWIPAFIYFRFTYLIPFFYLLVIWGIAIFGSKTLRTILITSILLINIFSFMYYFLEPSQQREQWRQATSFIENIAGKGDVVLFEFSDPFAPYLWYSKGRVDAKGALDSISANPKKAREKTIKLISNKNGIYYFEYLRDLSDPGRVVEDEIIQSGFLIEKEYGNFFGVGKITYFVKK